METTILILVIIAVLLQAVLLWLVLARRSTPTAPIDLAPTHDRIETGRRDVLTAIRTEAELGRTSGSAAADRLRDELRKSQNAFAETIAHNTRAIAAAQDAQLQAFSTRLDALTNTLAESASRQRAEVAQSLKTLNESLLQQLAHASQQQVQQLDAFSHKLAQFGAATSEQLDKARIDAGSAAKATRDDIHAQLKLISETMTQRQAELSLAQKTQLELLAGQVKEAMDNHRQQAELLRLAVEKQLNAVREDNTQQLEKMRATVDEKLQGTLEKRLGESFKQVSDRLEQVHKGLGEMQTLASGVGDLKKVLSNVKVRGNWGEVQLGNLLEQMLTAGQYETNVAVTGEGRDRVEFAIKLPGKGDDDQPVWLPIDAKFPQSDYQRLVEASDRGDAEGVEAASKALESNVWGCAKTIKEKYIRPPQTTHFGILFLPTEGLYAEVLRRPGFADSIQHDLNILIAGPTTLTALLNSLQMGFRTLAIQKQSGEVAKVLGQVKGDFEKFSDTLRSVKTKLDAASNSIEAAQKRTEIIGKKLRKAGELNANVDDDPVVLPPLASENGDDDAPISNG